MKSMTGLGIGRVKRSGFECVVEVRSVNHRFLEVGMTGIHAPRLQSSFTELLKKHFQRGKFDIYFKFENTGYDSTLDPKQVKRIKNSYQTLKQLFVALGYKDKPDFEDLITYDPHAFAFQKWKPDDFEKECFVALQKAIKMLKKSREQEGKGLKAVLVSRLKTLIQINRHLATEAPKYVQKKQKQMREKIQASLMEFSAIPQKLESEIVQVADKLDVSEEIDRLGVHLAQFGRLLNQKEPVGRQIDFLIQEVHREFNTIGSKIQAPELIAKVIYAKTEIEKIREQVQNVE